MIEGIPTLLTVTAHDQTFPIPMHGEMYFGADRPAVLWFRCVRAPRFGGDTLLADGAEIAEQLGASARRLFETKRLLYVRDDGTVRTEFPCSAFTADGRFINSILPLVQAEAAFARIDQSHDPRFPRRGFPISVRLEDGQRIPDEVLEDVERAVKASTFRLRWRNGDVAMLDNARVMHGRGKSVATDREIQVRLAMPDGRR
jgi:alpha-ketoglutarate-dependent taurine dioxygenase